MNYPTLFSPCKIGSLTVKNRIIMTAMGTGLANLDGTVSEEMIAFYEERAKGGVGTIVTEVGVVDGETGQQNPWQISVYDDKFIPGLTKLGQVVQQYGTALFVQLVHPGCQGHVRLAGNKPLPTPSGVESPALHEPCRAMTVDEIHALVRKFAEGAARVKASGIAGVEVHAAHGYLLTQFLSPFSNKRTDEYGGTLENRCRIIKEIILAIREKVGPDYPVSLRISADEFLETAGIPEPGFTLPEGIAAVKYLQPFGFDLINVSSGSYPSQNCAWEPIAFQQGWRTYLAEEVKKVLPANIPVVSASVYRDPDFCEKVLAEGKCDFVAIARGQLAEPEWCNKASSGREDEIRPCLSCLHCMENLSGRDKTECAVNARSHHEYELGELTQVGNGRVVAVVGGGPGGMESARVLALRGFKPVLFERHARLGGQLCYAAKPPHKDKINRLMAYYARQFELLGVEVRLNTEATVEAIEALDPCAVFVAAGSQPVIPRSIPGVDKEGVYSTVDLLSGNVSFSGKNTVIIGSGMTGLETAELLVELGNQVSVVEMLPSIGPGAYIQNLLDVLGRLGQAGVQLFPGHKLMAIEDGAVLLERQEDGEQVRLAADCVVLSMGVRAETGLRDALTERFGDKVHPIGDSIQVGRIANAVRTGYKVAAELA